MGRSLFVRDHRGERATGTVAYVYSGARLPEEHSPAADAAWSVEIGHASPLVETLRAARKAEWQSRLGALLDAVKGEYPHDVLLTKD